MSPSNGSKSVKIITAAEYQASLSKNNNLAKLEVEGYEIEPEFNKDTLEYTVSINEGEESVNIIATAEDKKSNIIGSGKQEVSAGNNSFDIVVIAENGSEKTYKLSVNVIDKNPIEVTYKNKTYTVAKYKTDLTAPIGYTESTAVIDSFEVPSYYSEITGYTLVTLKDEEGTPSYFIYTDGNYIKYIELNFGKLILYPLSMNKEVDGYTKSKVSIQGENIECLETKKDSRFKLIYGLNIETNEKGLYLYDTVDDIAIAYDNEIVDILNNKIKIITYVAIGLALSTFICLVIMISNKKGGKVPKEKKEKNKKEVVPNDTYIEKDEVKEKEPDEQEDFFDIFESDSKKKKKNKK